MSIRKVRVWDIPTRLFHWLLVLAVAAAWITADWLDNQMNWHQWVGISIVALVSFRLVWGFIGGTYARFMHFIKPPIHCVSYINGQWQGIGHNPLGGWSIVVMLLLLISMVLTGLFANNDADYTAPLSFLVSNDMSSQLTRIHKWLFNVLWVVIALHVAAVLFYKWVLKRDLITPMISGDAPALCDADESSQGGGWKAVLVALSIAALVVWGASALWHQPAPKASVPQGLDF